MRAVLFCDLDKENLLLVIKTYYKYWRRYDSGLTIEQVVEEFCSYKGRRMPYGVAMVDGLKLIGFFVIQKENPKAGVDVGPWITKAFVLPEYRRQNYGTKLVELALDRLKMHGYKRAYVWTTQASLFCKKLGFTYYKTVFKTNRGDGDIFYKDIK